MLQDAFLPEPAKLILVALCAIGIAACCYGMLAVARRRQAPSGEAPRTPRNPEEPRPKD